MNERRFPVTEREIPSPEVAEEPVRRRFAAEQMNLSPGFRAVVNVRDLNEKVMLRVAASTIYRAWINGELVAHGPARGPHGSYRMDKIDVTPQRIRASSM